VRPWRAAPYFSAVLSRVPLLKISSRHHRGNRGCQIRQQYFVTEGLLAQVRRMTA
jgi:hypothetical protein